MMRFPKIETFWKIVRALCLVAFLFGIAIWLGLQDRKSGENFMDDFENLYPIADHG